MATIKYEGQVVRQKGGFVGVILKIQIDDSASPNHDIAKTHDADTYEEAAIWVDDEISRMTTGKGVWE